MRLNVFKLMGVLLVAGVMQAQAVDSKTNVSSTLVKYPENQFKTADGRLFMSSKSGLFEVMRNADGTNRLDRLTVVYRTPVNGSVPATNTPCYFMGITQVGQNLLTACAVSSTDTGTPRYLLTLNLQDSTRTVREISRLNDVALPNGLNTNPNGLVILADTGGALSVGKLLQIVLKNSSDPMQGFTLKTWLSSGGHPNGVKTTANAVYWSENPFLWVIGNSKVYRTEIRSDGEAGATQTLYSSYGALDDIALVKDGLLICEFGNKRLVHLREQDKMVLHTTATSLAKPSSVILESSQISPRSTLWVTEYDSGALVALKQDWGLQPR